MNKTNKTPKREKWGTGKMSIGLLFLLLVVGFVLFAWIAQKETDTTSQSESSTNNTSNQKPQAQTSDTDQRPQKEDENVHTYEDDEYKFAVDIPDSHRVVKSGSTVYLHQKTKRRRTAA